MKICQVCKCSFQTRVTKCANLLCSRACASFYYRWGHIIRRCTKPSHPRFRDYGGRGVGVSAEWLIFSNYRDDMYTTFVEHVAEHGILQTTIERIDNDRGYSLQNCRWATRSEQGQNRRKVQKLCSSQHIGVNWFEPAKRWVARISVNKQRYFLGGFDSEEEAAIYYDVARQLFFR